jgi:hypothetical protein
MARKVTSNRYWPEPLLELLCSPTFSDLRLAVSAQQSGSFPASCLVI